MKRIRCHDAASLLGVPPRTVQALAARGDLPSAAKVGKVWTFDPLALERHLKALQPCRKDRPRITPIGAGKRYGRGSRSPGASIELAYELAISRLRNGAFLK
jgi:hypothetical protein